MASNRRSKTPTTTSLGGRWANRIQSFAYVAPDQLLANPLNARRHPGLQRDALRSALDRVGWISPVIVNVTTGNMVDGHARTEEALTEGLDLVPVLYVELSPEEELVALASFDPIGDLALYDPDVWAELSAAIGDVGDELRAAFTDLDFGLPGGPGGPDDDTPPAPDRPSLVDRFGVPCFSVLDSRQGYWQTRKQAWLSLGIRSDAGRGADVETDEDAPKQALTLARLSGRVPDYYYQKTQAETRLGRTLTIEEFEADHLVMPEGPGLSTSGTSTFDPVLCELAYRWFCPPGGHILDPFAGGSVRGVVAALLGRRYLGVDLSATQVAANRVQADAICSAPDPTDDVLDPAAVTPVIKVGNVWVKRDDAFRIGDSRGGKVRACRTIIEDALAAGPVAGLITAGSRQSPQVNIVATLARSYGLPCRVHVPSGDLTPELLAAEAAGAEVVQHKPGYNNVIIARAREDAAERGWLEIPFGMEHAAIIEATSAQVRGLPRGVKRIVVPVGSGMALAGILHGLGKSKLPVLAVQVGADPTERVDKYAPEGWRDRVTLVQSPLDYHAHAPETKLGPVELDPIYEAKLIPYLEDGDLLWVVGRRATVTTAGTTRWIVGDSSDLPALLPEDYETDLVFSCPPYYDLEVYSDDPADLSNMPWPDFVRVYKAIIKASVDRLRPDRFACFVVGEVRAPDGIYRDFVGLTVDAFVEAGCSYYNEAILVTTIGSLAVRSPRQFMATRKLGKTHQNVLVFVKGDPKRATEACGPVDVTMPEAEEIPE